MNDKYAIQGNKFFYFYDYSDDPYPEGILESENFVEQIRGKPVSNNVAGPF